MEKDSKKKIIKLSKDFQNYMDNIGRLTGLKDKSTAEFEEELKEYKNKINILEKSKDIIFSLEGFKADIFKDGWLGSDNIKEKAEERELPNDLYLVVLILLKDIIDQLISFIKGDHISPVEYFIIFTIGSATSNKMVSDFLIGYKNRDVYFVESEIYKELLSLKTKSKKLLNDITMNQPSYKRYKIYEKREREEKLKYSRLYSAQKVEGFNLIKCEDRRGALKQILEISWTSTISGVNNNILKEHGLSGWLGIHYQIK
jgi:hypothetical protein